MGKQWKQWLTLFFWAPKIAADGDCSHEIKRPLLLGRQVITNRDSILKSGDISLPTKVRLVKAVVFPVVMYGCESWDYKESWAPKNWWWCVDFKEIQPVHPKGDQSWVFIGRTDVEAETPILWPPNAKSWLIWKTLMLGKIEGRRRRGQQRMRWFEGITDSRTWVWVNSRSWWWSGGPVVLQSMGSQRVGHD